MEEEKRPLGDFVSIFAFEMFYFKYSTRDNFFIIFEDFETNKNNQNDEILITTIWHNRFCHSPIKWNDS